MSRGEQGPVDQNLEKMISLINVLRPSLLGAIDVSVEAILALEYRKLWKISQRCESDKMSDVILASGCY
jgi:hypothetical protein